MESLTNVFNYAFRPDLLKDKRLTALNGLQVLLLFAVLLVVVNTVVTALTSVVEGTGLAGGFTLNAFNSLNLFLMTVVTVIVASLVSAFVAEPLFKGSGNYGRTLGFVGYTVIPIFVVTSLSILLLFVSSLTGHALKGIYAIANPLLLLASFAWMFFIGTRAVAFSNNISPTGGLVSYFMGFVVASSLNTPITQFLGPLSMTALAALGGV
jgi:hypothetical protein